MFKGQGLKSLGCALICCRNTLTLHFYTLKSLASPLDVKLASPEIVLKAFSGSSLSWLESCSKTATARIIEEQVAVCNLFMSVL